MSKRGIGIAGRLIIISTVLLGLVVGLFGVINSLESRRIIDEYARRQLRESIVHLREAGATEMRLLVKAVRVALVQSDFATLQTVVSELGGQGGRVTTAVVIDNAGRVLAHVDRRRVGTAIAGLPASALTVRKLSVFPDIDVGGTRSIVFAAPVTYAADDGEAVRASDSGTRLATLVLGLSLKRLQEQAVRNEEIKRAEVRKSIRNALLVGLLSLLLGAGLTVVQALRMTRPILALARQAERMAGGELTARVAVNSSDEIGMLGSRFNYMAERIVELLKDEQEKTAMAKELEVARAVQATLVPASEVSTVSSLTIAGYFKPATQCGGDWWSYFPLPDDRVMVIIGDVTGHGVGSAMITAAARGAATTLISSTGGHLSLDALLQLLNGTILSTARGEFAMTCFASIFDHAAGVLLYSNAGHNPPYLYRAGSGQLSALPLPSDRLGDFPDSEFEVREVKVAAEDVLFWYTDGLVEGTDPRGEPFGDQRFQEAIRRHARLAPEDAVDQIVGTARQHFGEAEQDDDITLVVGRID